MSASAPSYVLDQVEEDAGELQFPKEFENAETLLVSSLDVI